MARDILSRQALVQGRVTDSITAGGTRAPPHVSLVRAADGRPVEHVAARVLPDGFFVVHGDPARVLPPRDMALRLDVEAEGYAPARVAINLTVADLARETRTITVGGVATDVLVIAAAPLSRDLALEPLPVVLAGRISRAEDPGQPIAGASVEATAPAPAGPVLTDAAGYYRLGPLPVAPTVTLSIAAAGRQTATPAVRPDYRSPTNQKSFTLEPI